MNGKDNKIYKILVPTDFSKTSDFALSRAVSLAGTNAEITLLHIMQRTFADKFLEKLIPDDGLPSPMELTKIQLEEKIRTLTKLNVRYVIVSQGKPALKILQYAKKNNFNLIVMGAHGKYTMRDSIVGTTAETVVKKTRCPVLIVKRNARKTYHKILVASDFSSVSKKALQFATQLFPNATIKLIHVGDYEYEDLLKEESFRGKFPAAKIAKIRKVLLLHLENKMKKFVKGYHKVLAKPAYKITLGYPAPAIIEEGKKKQIDLAVLGTQGHSWHHYLFVGHVANGVLTGIDKDILLIPPIKKNKSKR